MRTDELDALAKVRMDQLRCRFAFEFSAHNPELTFTEVFTDDAFYRTPEAVVKAVFDRIDEEIKKAGSPTRIIWRTAPEFDYRQHGLLQEDTRLDPKYHPFPMNLRHVPFYAGYARFLLTDEEPK